MAKALLGLAGLALAKANVVITYGGDTEQTLQSNAIDISPYTYQDVRSSDSHNGDLELCERVWKQGDDERLSMCCSPADRGVMIMGCAPFRYEEEPVLCDATDELLCEGVGSTEVATYFITYTSMDFSENTATPVDITVVYHDIIPPIIPVPDDCGDGDYVYDIEKCTYFEEYPLTALDETDLYIEATSSVSFFELGEENVIFGDNYGTQSLLSGVYCDGGEVVSEVDTGTPGVYCVEYSASDTSYNEATTETLVVYVEDTTPPEVSLEIPETTIECATYDALPDPVATATNLPCLDYPPAWISYERTDHPDLCERNDGDCEDVWMVMNHMGTYEVPYVANDGYNTGTAVQTISTIDTTDPIITCPNDRELCVIDDNYELDDNDAFAYDSCSPNINHYIEDNREVVDDDTIGDYEVSFTATDMAGNSDSCTQRVGVYDCSGPEINIEADEYLHIEACTGTYVEYGATATDNYDSDIQSKVTTTYLQDIDIDVAATYIVTYDACDQSDNCAESATRYVIIEDTVPPVVTTNGPLIFGEASVYDIDAVVDASDECGVEDLYWTVVALSYSRCASFDYYVTSEYWVNVFGQETADEYVYYCGATYEAAVATADYAEQTQSADELAANCAAYEITYSAVDVNSNIGTASQDVWVIDTVAPTIYIDYFAHVQSSLSGSVSGVATLLACSAFVAGVLLGARKSRAGYDEIPAAV